MIAICTIYVLINSIHKSDSECAHRFISAWELRRLCHNFLENNDKDWLKRKNDRNGGIWQSGISKFLTENVQRPVCFVNVQSSLHENVVFSVCAHMDNAAYIISIMWNSISGLEASYHFQFNISCGVAVTVRSDQKKISGIIFF